MITLYGGKMNRGGRCSLALEECGVAYELRDLKLQAGEQKTPEFLKLNPNGAVPPLVDGSTVVWESMAINLYLAEKYGQGLLPTAMEERAHTYQWTVWAVATLEPYLVTLFMNRVLLPEAERNAAAAEAAAKRAGELLQTLDHALEGKSCLVGGRFTIADVNTGHVVAWAGRLGIDLSALANVQRWFGLLAARPSFQKLLS